MNIIIIENNSLTREVLQLLLKKEGGFESIETYATADEAINEANWHGTEILLLDVDRCGMPAAELIKWVRENHPQVDSMAHSLHDDGEIMFSTIQAGATDFQIKNNDPKQLINALYRVQENDGLIDSAVAGKVVNQMLADGDKSLHIAFNSLATMDQKILKMVSNGYTYKDIAEEFSITLKSVHTHIRNVCKLIQFIGSNKVAC